jgi:hypothetical protein
MGACGMFACLWPRETDFSQLPSAVISTIDHPLGSPSFLLAYVRVFSSILTLYFLQVWRGRYVQAVKQTPWVRGGKNTLVAVFLTTIFIMALEVGRRLVGV